MTKWAPPSPSSSSNVHPIISGMSSNGMCVACLSSPLLPPPHTHTYAACHARTPTPTYLPTHTHLLNRYIIYVIKDDKIQIEKQGAREKTWDDFTADLPETDCRYAVIDVEFETDDGRPTSKIVFLSWAPDSAKVCMYVCVYIYMVIDEKCPPYLPWPRTQRQTHIYTYTHTHI